MVSEAHRLACRLVLLLVLFSGLFFDLVELLGKVCVKLLVHDFLAGSRLLLIYERIES